MNQHGKSLPYEIEEEKMKLIFPGDKNLKKNALTLILTLKN